MKDDILSARGSRHTSSSPKNRNNSSLFAILNSTGSSRITRQNKRNSERLTEQTLQSQPMRDEVAVKDASKLTTVISESVRRHKCPECTGTIALSKNPNQKSSEHSCIQYLVQLIRILAGDSAFKIA